MVMLPPRAMTAPVLAALRRTAATATAAVATAPVSSKMPTQVSTTYLGARAITISSVVSQSKRTGSESNEAMLMQQMLDAMGADEDEGGDASAAGAMDATAEFAAPLPLTGVVLELKNGIANVSGLRHATTGSVVTLHATRDDQTEEAIANDADATVCRGIVLFLHKKTAHVALLGDDHGRVRRGMTARLEATELRIPGSIAWLSGRVISPLGEPFHMLQHEDEHEEDAAPEVSANDRISLAWGSQRVPRMLARAPLREPFPTGVEAIDCLQPLAFGHRVALLGPRQSGKTQLMRGILIAAITQAQAASQPPPHVVYVSVGKPSAHVQQLVQQFSQADVLPHVTVVAASDRDSLVAQYLAPFTGCAVAEYFATQGASRRSIVVYDDLAMHTSVVEALVASMSLPRVATLSLGAHAVLLERSAQFHTHSLTSFVLAETPDPRTEIESELQARLSSLVDDTVLLDPSLARARVYPPVDVLRAGASIRGPPFQSAARWTHLQRVRARINEASHVKEMVDVTKSLGLEIEPEQAEVVAFQALVREFFEQPAVEPPSESKPQLPRDPLTQAMGVFFLSVLQVSQLPRRATLTEVLSRSVDALRTENPELAHTIETYPFEKTWTREMETELEKLLQRVLRQLQHQHQHDEPVDDDDGSGMRLPPSRAELLRRARIQRG